jgi:hypothetical protein
VTTVEIPVPTVEPIVAQGRPIASPGSMNVDWEERWNVDRLRTYRLGRARDALAASDLGAMLLFDFNNIRYVTSTHIGEWAATRMSGTSARPPSTTGRTARGCGPRTSTPG